MRPFSIENPNKEIPWIKDWFRNQIINGRMAMRIEAINLANNEDILRYIRDLDKEQRRRLRKAISSRKSRKERTSKGWESPVRTEVTRYARNILTTVAEHRGISTSELIEELAGEEFERIEDNQLR